MEHYAHSECWLSVLALDERKQARINCTVISCGITNTEPASINHIMVANVVHITHSPMQHVGKRRIAHPVLDATSYRTMSLDFREALHLAKLLDDKTFEVVRSAFEHAKTRSKERAESLRLP